MYKTFEELERLAYMSNLPKIAVLYAQLDANEHNEYEIERLRSKIDDLESDCEYHKWNSKALGDKVKTLEIKIRDIQDVIDE